MIVRKLVALLVLPVAIVGLYTAYQSYFSTEATCRNLRDSILSALDKPIDADAKRVLVHKDLTRFERACTLTDPDAKAVFAALDRSVLFASDPDKASARPVRFVPLPPFLGRPWLYRPGSRPLQRLFEQRRGRLFGT